MATQLVPYTNAMRLGQGFNSYSQQICVDNAVIGMISEDDPRPFVSADLVKASTTSITPPSTGTSTAGSTAPANSTGGPTASSIVESVPPMARMPPNTKVLDDMTAETQKYPSQIVTYTSQYCSKVSDVSKSLNVSGSLSIKYGEISGRGSGSYVNSDTFNSSSINFLLTVKVVNQTLFVRDDLAFWPLARDYGTKVSATTLTNTYGDSFISGFEEGGMFSALISIRGYKQDNEEKIKAAAQLTLQVGLGSIEADADVDIQKKLLNDESEINITVNWAGGGQLKQSSEKWSIEEVIAVATRFPDMVAGCPQRTHAILTKYTALRGFLEWQAKTNAASPLDYEICQLYTADLLDIYMGYKSVWSYIHTLLQDLDLGLTKIKPSSGYLLTNGLMAQITIPGTTSTILSPYEADYIGLDSALQTCRNLMVLLVQEVDALTQDPALAIKIGRVPVYIRPQIFQQYLPVEVKPERKASPQYSVLAKYAAGFGPDMALPVPAAFSKSYAISPAFDADPVVLYGTTFVKLVLPPGATNATSSVTLTQQSNKKAINLGWQATGSDLSLMSMGTNYAAFECDAVKSGILDIAATDEINRHQVLLPDGGINEPYTVLAWPLTWTATCANGNNISVRASASVGTSQLINIDIIKLPGTEMSVQWIAFPKSAPGIDGFTSGAVNGGTDSFADGKFTSPPKVFVAISGYQAAQIPRGGVNPSYSVLSIVSQLQAKSFNFQLFAPTPGGSITLLECVIIGIGGGIVGTEVAGT